MCSLRRSWCRVPQSQNALPVYKAELCSAWLAALTMAEQVCHPPMPCPVPRPGVQELWAGFCQALEHHGKADKCTSLAALTLLASWSYPIPLLLAKSSKENMVKQATSLDPRNPNLLWSSLLGIHESILPYLWSERTVLKHQFCASSWQVCIPYDGKEHIFIEVQNLGKIHPRATLPVVWHRMWGGTRQQQGQTIRVCRHYLRGSRGREIWDLLQHSKE